MYADRVADAARKDEGEDGQDANHQPGNQGDVRFDGLEHPPIRHRRASRCCQFVPRPPPRGRRCPARPDGPSAPRARGRGCVRSSTTSVAFPRSAWNISSMSHGDRLVLDDDVELTVAHPAGDVEIRRADARPSSVRDGRLGVQHRAVPLEDPHAGLEERPIARAREGSQDRNVRRARNEQPDVHAVPRGRSQRLHVQRRARRNMRRSSTTCGGPSPQRADRRETCPPCTERSPQRAAARLPAGRCRSGIGSSDGSGVAGGRPGFRKRTLDVGHGRPAHHESRCRARDRARVRIADPHLADAKTGHERDGAVDGDHLAVIPTHPSERTIEPGRVVASDLDAARAQPVPEAARRFAKAAHPVVEEPDRHAVGGLAHQRVGEQPSLIVFVDDVHLEVDRAPGTVDGLEPGRIVLVRVPQDATRDCHRATVRRTRAKTPGRRAAERRGSKPARAFSEHRVRVDERSRVAGRRQWYFDRQAAAGVSRTKSSASLAHEDVRRRRKWSSKLPLPCRSRWPRRDTCACRGATSLRARHRRRATAARCRRRDQGAPSDQP